ncbi:MAG: hypothetical protein WDN00_18830 [Limisphaerales bacterium]
MSLLALAFLLFDRPMQRRFNANPFLKSAELLLHERVPKETSVLYPHELEADAERTSSAPARVNVARFHRSKCGAAGSPSAFQRTLSRHGYECRRRLQPLE